MLEKQVLLFDEDGDWLYTVESEVPLEQDEWRSRIRALVQEYMDGINAPDDDDLEFEDYGGLTAYVFHRLIAQVGFSEAKHDPFSLNLGQVRDQLGKQ